MEEGGGGGGGGGNGKVRGGECEEKLDLEVGEK